MIKIWGIAQSRAFRCLWAAEELGLSYEQAKIGFVDGKVVDPQLRRVNPNGKLPALSDGDLTLFESLAINLYLVDKHGGPLKPANPAEFGLTCQWTLWAANEIEMPVLDWSFHSIVYPPEKRDAKIAAAARDKMDKALAILDAALAGRQYLAAERFTVADLNVAAVCYRLLQYPELGRFANVKAWVDRCWARPAAIKARKIREG